MNTTHMNEPIDYNFIDYNFIDYNYIRKNKKFSKENKDNKTIIKMLNKKMSRQITKKHYSNITRKISVYNF